MLPSLKERIVPRKTHQPTSATDKDEHGMGKNSRKMPLPWYQLNEVQHLECNDVKREQSWGLELSPSSTYFYHPSGMSFISMIFLFLSCIAWVTNLLDAF